MKAFLRFIFWSIIGWSFGILILIPFAYGIAHGAESLLLIPIVFSLFGGIISLWLDSDNTILRYWGRFLLGGMIFLGILVFYFFFLNPILSMKSIKSAVMAISPEDIIYTPITYSGKNIGILVNARFAMNPDISQIESHSYWPSLPKISLNPYSYGLGDGMKIVQDWKNYLLSGASLFPWIIYTGSGFCTRESYSGELLSSWIYTGNLLYPYIEWACYRWWECFTRYDIPGTDFSIDVDASIYSELLNCS